MTSGQIIDKLTLQWKTIYTSSRLYYYHIDSLSHAFPPRKEEGGYLNLYYACRRQVVVKKVVLFSDALAHTHTCVLINLLKLTGMHFLPQIDEYPRLHQWASHTLINY